MAWEELLRLHDDREEVPAQLREAEPKDRGSLIQQLRAMAGSAGAEQSAEPEELQETVLCRDGYVRRAPVQPYRTAEDFGRRRIRRLVIALVLLALAALLFLVLMRSGLLVFRFR